MRWTGFDNVGGRAVALDPKRINDRFQEFRDKEQPGVDVISRVVDGAPRSEVVRAASEDGIDLVLLGTRGLLGSVAQGVAREAPCSVTVIPSGEEV